MARSYFIYYPGLTTPDRFKAGAQPQLLSLQDLWDEARSTPPCLIFRVRSESDPMQPLAGGDKLESCVGMIDSATRWRSVFNMTRTAINAIRHPVLSQACMQAMQFISTQHPASVTPAQRFGILAEIMKIAKGQVEEAGDKMPVASPFEQAIASGVASLIQADNDFEAAYLVPFTRAYNPFPEGPEQGARMTTIETMAGAVLLSEASNRLAERLPQWLQSAMPELGQPAAPTDQEEDD